MHTYCWNGFLKAFRGNQYYEFSLWIRGFELIFWIVAPKRFWQQLHNPHPFTLRVVFVRPSCQYFTLINFGRRP